MQTPSATILPITKHLYRRYKYDAIRRGKVFGITLEYFATIIEQPCAYCGAVKDNTYTQKQYAIDTLRYNGVDRVDSNGAYTEDNCVAACGDCNAAKSNRDVAFVASDWLINRRAAMAAQFNGRNYRRA